MNKEARVDGRLFGRSEVNAKDAAVGKVTISFALGPRKGNACERPEDLEISNGSWTFAQDIN